MHTFLTYYVSLLLVMVIALNRVPSFLCFHVIINFVLTVDMPLSIYPVVLHSSIISVLETLLYKGINL